MSTMPTSHAFITTFMLLRAAYIEAVISFHTLVTDQSPLRLTWVIRGDCSYERCHISDMQLILKCNGENYSDEIY
jgi:hypothetical protein